MFSNENGKIYIDDIANSISRLKDMLDKNTEENFIRIEDKKTLHAIYYEIIAINQAAQRLPEETLMEWDAEIDWKAFKDLANYVIEDYDQIDPNVVMSMLFNKYLNILPKLKQIEN